MSTAVEVLGIFDKLLAKREPWKLMTTSFRSSIFSPPLFLSSTLFVKYFQPEFPTLQNFSSAIFLTPQNHTFSRNFFLFFLVSFKLKEK